MNAYSSVFGDGMIAEIKRTQQASTRGSGLHI